MINRYVGLILLVATVAGWHGLIWVLVRPWCPAWLMPVIFLTSVSGYVGSIMLAFGISAKRIWWESRSWPWYKRLVSALSATFFIMFGYMGLMGIYMTRHQVWN